MKLSIEAEKILKDTEKEIKDKGFKIVDFKTIPGKQKTTFRVVIHHKDGITHKDCGYVSKLLESSIENNWIKPYAIEISSPGIGRRLTKIEEYKIFKESMIKIIFTEEKENRKNECIYKIMNIENNCVTLKNENDIIVDCEIEEIKKAVLV